MTNEEVIASQRATIEQQNQRIKDLEAWQRIVLGTGTDQESVIRMAATEYTKVAIQSWKEKVEQQAKEIERLQALTESWRNIQQEEMCYVMKEVAALGMDFDKDVIVDGKSLWDVTMARIAELRKAESKNQALRKALKDLLDLMGDDCRLDHHGYCQNHFLTIPCVVKQAQAALQGNL